MSTPPKASQRHQRQRNFGPSAPENIFRAKEFQSLGFLTQLDGYITIVYQLPGSDLLILGW